MHRALHDAQATGELLLLFLARLAGARHGTLEEVARFCEPGYAPQLSQDRRSPRSCPTSPGVYIMRDAQGAPLYIGKAENLRRRTRDHFLQRQAYHARQALELLEHIDVVETGSEFGALLLESRLIGKHRPPYNSQGTRAGSYHYVKLSAEEYPRLYATPNLRDDGSYYAGPFRKASVARRFVDTVNGAYPLRTCAHLPRDARQHACQRADTGACLSPCRRTLNGEYAAVVDEVRRVLEGQGDALDARLVERQQVFIKTLAFEQAARLQNQRETLERVLRTVRRLRSAEHDDLVLAYPAHRRGWVALWGVRGGRVAVEREVGRGAFGEEAARAFLAELRRGRAAAPAAAGGRHRRGAAGPLLGRGAPCGAQRGGPAQVLRGRRGRRVRLRPSARGRPACGRRARGAGRAGLLGRLTARGQTSSAGSAAASSASSPCAADAGGSSGPHTGTIRNRKPGTCSARSRSMCRLSVWTCSTVRSPSTKAISTPPSVIMPMK